ncbi:hypothetical protein CW304_13505 [Bacillus sp. UFRGS-B20]|nr:hypothetical protein CW304_13505 [Bacillus sp. UFRGS-B20]
MTMIYVGLHLAAGFLKIVIGHRPYFQYHCYADSWDFPFQFLGIAAAKKSEFLRCKCAALQGRNTLINDLSLIFPLDC